MSKKTMMINATDPEEIRVATIQDGILLDFDVEYIHNEKIKGNIYKAKVVRADQSLQAAFVHYGAQKNGFLPLGELPRDLVSPDGRRGRIQDLLNRDQEIMVQVVREELGSKGAMLTAQISLPGRYLVLTPGNPTNGISRKIESREEREYFKQLVDEMEIPKNMGVIVRTASLGVTKDDFQKDLEYLLDTYKEVLNRYKHRQGPGLVWQEDDVVTRTLRDTFSSDMEEVLIDDLETFQAAQNFFKRTMPQHAHVLKHYVGKKPLFSKNQAEEQIDRIYARKVGLPSGGALVLDQTEALVAIDVNSGKTSGDGVEDMAFRTNLEAAEEVARQLRLRDLAGLVVIDFIDMKRETHNKAILDRLVECLREDKARMEVGKINRFGVLVMTRQRLRPSIHQTTHVTCPQCQGTGQVKGLDALLLSVVRRLKGILSRGDVKEVRVKLTHSIALPLLNQKRRELQEMEDAFDANVQVLADPEMSYGEMAVEIERREEEAEDKPARHHEAKHAEPEEETVVLGGESSISFEKALGQPSQAQAKPAEFKHDRRDVQRAAIEERERLRALFESAKPEGEASQEGELEKEAEEATSKSGRRRRRSRGSAGKDSASKPESQPRVTIEPPKLTGEVVAALLLPTPRPRRLGAAALPPAATPESTAAPVASNPVPPMGEPGKTLKPKVAKAKVPKVGAPGEPIAKVPKAPRKGKSGEKAEEIAVIAPLPTPKSAPKKKPAAKSKTTAQ